MSKGNLCSTKIGKKIKELRTDKGLDVVNFSQRLSVSKVTVNNWEKGKFLPSLHNVVNICNLLKISVDELVLFED